MLQHLPSFVRWFSITVLWFLSLIYVPTVGAQQTLENPPPDSFQSGVGVISGWACEAQTIEISFDGGPRLRAATGTIREDTLGVCGDTDNGYGLLYNWNRLGDGSHTVTAYADGVEFATVTVIVTTLGTEFLRGASSTHNLDADFLNPPVGPFTGRTLRWQEAQQNFVITTGDPPQGGGTSGAAPHVLENPPPGSFQSGVGVISGWACEAQTIEISFDGGPRIQAGTGTIREDTQGVCGDTNNGFGLLYNWNRLGDGVHTVTAYADGVEFARVNVTVTTLGEEFLRGQSREVLITDFPTAGANVVLSWQEARQNFVIVEVHSGEREVACLLATEYRFHNSPGQEDRTDVSCRSIGGVHEDRESICPYSYYDSSNDCILRFNALRGYREEHPYGCEGEAAFILECDRLKEESLIENAKCGQSPSTEEAWVQILDITVEQGFTAAEEAQDYETSCEAEELRRMEEE